MSNCKGRALARKTTLKAIDKNTEINLTIMKDIDACAKINTRRYIEAKDSAVYSPTTKPDDLLNICEATGCKNTGTLMISAKTATAEGKFSVVSDATEYVAGVVYYYVYLKPGTYSISTTLSDLKDEKQNNADTYTQTKTATREGFYPITIDLSVTPTETKGDGWTASTNGTIIDIAIKNTAQDASSIEAGISSISFFDEIEDLENNEVVKLACASSIGGDITLDQLESTCAKNQLDGSSASVEVAVSATSFTPNAIMLNPMIEKEDVVDGFFIHSQVFTVEQAPNNEDYGYLHISDANTDACGYIYASLDDNCNITDSILRRVNNPNLMALDERQFQVLDTKQNADLDIVGIELYFNKAQIGKEVLISYPKTADEAEVYKANVDGVNDRRVKLTYQKELSDNVIDVYEYPNVLVTSFPNTITSDDNELSYTFTANPDNDGNYFRVMRINREASML